MSGLNSFFAAVLTAIVTAAVAVIPATAMLACRRPIVESSLRESGRGAAGRVIRPGVIRQGVDPSR